MDDWKGIENWDGYEVSSAGEVRSWKKSRQTPNAALPRIISRWVLPNGYAVVTLKDRGRRENVYVHHAVARAFIGPRPDGLEVAHGDGDRLNNSISNLRYATPKENSADTLAHGRRAMGGAHYAALLTNEQARQLREFQGTHAAAARAFGISYHVAYCIRTNRTWRRV